MECSVDTEVGGSVNACYRNHYKEISDGLVSPRRQKWDPSVVNGGNDSRCLGGIMGSFNSGHSEGMPSL